MISTVKFVLLIISIASLTVEIKADVTNVPNLEKQNLFTLRDNLKNQNFRCGNATRLHFGENLYASICLRTNGKFIVDFRDFFPNPTLNNQLQPSIRGISLNYCQWQKLKKHIIDLDFMITALQIFYPVNLQSCDNSFDVKNSKSSSFVNIYKNGGVYYRLAENGDI